MISQNYLRCAIIAPALRAAARCALPGVGGLRPPRASRVRACAVAACWSLRAPPPPVLGPRGCRAVARRGCAGPASVGAGRGGRAVRARSACLAPRVSVAARVHHPSSCISCSTGGCLRAAFWFRPRWGLRGRCCGRSFPPPAPPHSGGELSRYVQPMPAAAALSRDYRGRRLVVNSRCRIAVLWSAAGAAGLGRDYRARPELVTWVTLHLVDHMSRHG